MSFKVIGTGMYVPEHIVTNDDLAKIVDTNDEWITQRVGIKERHISVDEFASDIGAKAALAALEQANCKPEDIDLILAATVSGETISPSMACMIQAKIGASCPALEMNAACAAFLFLLDTAAAYFALGRYKRILVVGTERMSGILDWSDRSTCVIFGDGAGAAVLEQGKGYLDAVCNVKGNDEVIRIPHGLGNSPYFRGQMDSPYVHMQGQETFKYAVGSICKDVQILLERNNLTMDDIAWIVPHQANKRIIDFACRKLKISEDRMFVNIEKYGNTSSASVPIALHELNASGKLKREDKIILCAFGGGLADMACLMEW